MYALTLGSTKGTGEAQRFASQARLADEALKALSDYGSQIKAAGEKEKTSWFGNEAEGAGIQNIGEMVKRFADVTGPRILVKAMDEHSFDQLRVLQRGIKNITTSAKKDLAEYGNTSVIPRNVSSFVDIVITGSIVDFGAGSRAVIEEAKKASQSARKLADAASSKMGLAVIGLVAVGAILWRFK